MHLELRKTIPVAGGMAGGSADAAATLVVCARLWDLDVGAAETLEETGYADACPIATVALEVASTNEPLRKATADVFDSWIAAGSEWFAAAGIPQGRARELARRNGDQEGRLSAFIRAERRFQSRQGRQAAAARSPHAFVQSRQLSVAF